MKNKFLYLLALILSASLFSGCSDDDDEKITPVQKSKLDGVVEKGPFVNGSTVTVYELDENLAQTGKSFNATTDNEGRFEINSSMAFVSQYIKVSVNGFYFNEVSGELSQAQITLEALADISNKNNVNANLITHLEAKRVMHLVSQEGIPFGKAKEQAEKELLACFLIKGKTIVPEATTITGNDTSADMLIAISSILLRSIEKNNQTDAQFTQLINDFRDDFEKDGAINDQLKQTIQTASVGLDYISVKNNIIQRYQELDKEVSVGNFHYFIDGDGDGQLSDTDYEIEKPDIITPEEYFRTEEEYRTALSYALQNTWYAMRDLYIYEALFTHAMPAQYDYWTTIYNHSVDARNEVVGNFWHYVYLSINMDNRIITSGMISSNSAIRDITIAAKVYRAYKYLYLIEYWGDVPFMTKMDTDPGEIFPERTPKDQIIKELITELEEAEQILPEKTNEFIPSKYFAAGLLARAYLLQSDYPKALAAASRIIESGIYSLCEEYTQNFNDKENSEGLFMYPPVKEFEADIRKGQEIPMMRYAEVLLIAAEADVKAGNKPQAIKWVNLLQKRNQRDLVKEDASLEIIQAAILQEWEMDLTKEARWFTALKRFGLAQETLQIPAYMELLPIPRSEMDLNPNMTQNPGY